MSQRDDEALLYAQPIIRRVETMATVTGIQLGARRGRISRKLLEHLPQLNLVMMDIWAQEVTPGDFDWAPVVGDMSEYERLESYHQAMRYTEFAARRRRLIRLEGRSPSDHFEDNSVDFVYVGESSTYFNTKVLVSPWINKVRDKGFICGRITGVGMLGNNAENYLRELSRGLREPFEFEADRTWVIHLASSSRISKPQTKKLNTTSRAGMWRSRGPSLWAEIHKGALTLLPGKAESWLKRITRKIPCGRCRRDWTAWVMANPPDARDNKKLFEWSVHAHNAINLRLGKKIQDADAARSFWINETHSGQQTNAGDSVVIVRSNTGDSVQTRSGGFVNNPVAAQKAVQFQCVFQTPTDRPSIMTCSKGLFGGRPHLEMCRRCTERVAPPLNVSGKEASRQVTSEVRPFDQIEFKTVFPSPIKKTIEKGNKLLLRSFLSPGDILTMTAAVRDLHHAHPGRFLTAVETSVPDIWENNPLITRLDSDTESWQPIDMHYPSINQSNQRPMHFIQGYSEFLEKQLGLQIPVSKFGGEIYLSKEERSWTNQVEETFGYRGRYWILMAGGKKDFTAKWWAPRSYQRVVDHFLGRVQFVQCGQRDHWHPPINGAFNLVGKTSIRQFIRLMYHAEGVVCPVTFAMHLAAATPMKDQRRLRPCVVLAGGREPPHWEAYPGHQFLHTIGSLSCCATGGCWKSRCQLIGDGDIKDREDLCERPVQIEPELRIPQCMAMIQPQDVVRCIERFVAYAE